MRCTAWAFDRWIAPQVRYLTDHRGLILRRLLVFRIVKLFPIVCLIVEACDSLVALQAHPFNGATGHLPLPSVFNAVC